MRPELEGKGGGFGRYAGLSLAELRDRFEACAADPSHRSVSAVLRIAREQLEARGGLGTHRWIPILAGVALLLSLGAPRVLPPRFADGVRAAQFGSAAALLLALVSFFSVRHSTRAAIVQERAIRELALDTLLRITADPGFRPKPLDPGHVRTLRELLRRTGRGDEALRRLLAD